MRPHAVDDGGLPRYRGNDQVSRRRDNGTKTIHGGDVKRREFIKAAVVAGAGLGSCVTAAERQNRSTTAGQPALPRHALGKTGAEVSILALGGVIGMQLPPSEKHDPAAIAEAALNLGITYFDTAPGYNKGQSETNYGQVLDRRPNEGFLA